MLHAIQQARVLIWRCLWTADVEGRPIVRQAALIVGAGRVSFGDHVRIGYWPSPGYLGGSCHIEARGAEARVRIGSRTTLNNEFTAIAEATSIEIGERCMIGPRVTIFDTDFHPLNRAARMANEPSATAPVRIGDDVFIGAGVTILKGVTIGDGAVLGANAVIVADVPADAIAGGNPARILKQG